jgi:uncharacterized membrane protein
MILAELHDVLILGGRLHPILVHLPIGILILVILFECFSNFKKFDYLIRVTPLIWLCGALSAVMAGVAGFLLASDGEYDDGLIQTHQWLGIALIGLSIGGYLLRVVAKPHQRMMTAYSLVVVIVLSLTGHYGGTLTHGEDFLNAPFASLVFSEKESFVSYERPIIADIEEAVIYRDLVHPILHQKCNGCHNRQRRKGKLNLEDYEGMNKGGRGGVVLVAGSSQESELFRRLILPVGDKKRMPPRGKKPLTESELELIRWWIEDGRGSKDVTVSEVKKSQAIHGMLASYTAAVHAEGETDSWIPKDEPKSISDDELESLRQDGLVVSRITGDWLSVNCVNMGSFSDDDLHKLHAYAENIVWLNASGTRISDHGTTILVNFRNLRRLNVSNTTLTDSGVKRLTELSSLQYLNLVGTRVSDESIPALQSLTSLRALYLWQSGVTPHGVERLRHALPHAEVNAGEGY